MSFLSLQNISTPYCLKEINLEVKCGEMLVVLGYTGAGKSTLLNIIAGFTEYSGNLYFKQQLMNKIPSQKRGIGYLFQDTCLFPHLTAFENIAFGLRANAYPPNEIKQKVEAMLELLQITHLKNRYPKNLSGGEKQRIGLGRSLIMEPQILLLDEPLSSLDPSTAKNIRKELKILHKSLNLTTLYVTHDFSEAKEMADRIAVIVNGELKQVGTAQDIFHKPVVEIKNFITAIQ